MKLNTYRICTRSLYSDDFLKPNTIPIHILSFLEGRIVFVLGLQSSKHFSLTSVPAILIVISSAAKGKMYECEDSYEVYISACQFCYQTCLEKDPKTTRCGKTTGGAFCYNPASEMEMKVKEYCEPCVKRFSKYYKM